MHSDGEQQLTATQTLSTLAQNNERYGGYTVFTIDFNGIPIKMMALADVKAIASHSYLIEEVALKRDETIKNVRACELSKYVTQEAKNTWVQAVEEFSDEIISLLKRKGA